MLYDDAVQAHKRLDRALEESEMRKEWLAETNLAIWRGGEREADKAKSALVEANLRLVGFHC